MKMRFRIFVVMSLLLPLIPLASNAQFYRLKTYGQPQENLNAVVKADLTNNGRTDAVGLTFKNPNAYVTAVLGDGKGGFLAPKNTQVTGLNLTNNLAIGDLNGDGFPDVVVSGSDPVTGVAAIGVMLGKGDGTFESTAVFPSGSGDAFSLTVTGDFNGDGKIDVALLTRSGVITVDPGKGDGTFGSPIRGGNANTRPGCVAAADFNQDGKLDLTIGTDVLLGKGDGTFHAPLPVPEGNCGVAIADLNHDGILDLITGNSPSDVESIRVHLGNGTGKFDAGTHYHTGHFPGNVVKAADLNGDGAPDIVVLNGGDSDFTILLNQGDGTFKAGKTYNGGPDAFSFFIANLNQDNKPDLAFNVEGSLGVILGNGDGTFQAELAQNDVNPAHGKNILTAIDMNNDHKADLILTDGGSSGIAGSVELGNGDGTFKSGIPFPTGCNATTVGDFNHDGKLDIAGPSSGFNPTGVVVCLGNGDGTFGNSVTYDKGVAHQFVLAGAFTHSGTVDLAASDQGGISILLGNGDGTFKSGIPTALNGSFPTFVLGDFNGDGNLDIAANTGGKVSVLLGKGNGQFSAPVTTSVPAGQLYVGDMNNDGKLDLVVLGSNSVSVWLGNGDGTFTQSSSITPPGQPFRAVLGDFNLDGNLDVAVTVFDRMQLLAGDGKGGLTSTLYLSGSAVAIATADFNGDKRPDIVELLAHHSNYNLIVFLNTLK
jgi:hypothetical protein